MKRILVGAALGLGLLVTSACGKQVDLAAAGATPVPGVNNLYRFCDGPIAVYFSNWGSASSDEYEFIVYDHPQCVTNEPVVPQSMDTEGQPRGESIDDGGDDK